MLAPGGLRDDCVRTEFGSYVHELDITGVFAPMADTDFECEHGRLAGDPCPSPKITASQAWPNLGLRAGDVVQNWPHPHPCGCWPSELAERVPADAPEEILTGVVEPTPDLMSILTPRREPLMLTAAPERDALPPAEAPFGRKADGTPRKRPAPSPERQLRMQAARTKAKTDAETAVVRSALEAAANVETPVAVTRRVVHLSTDTLLGRILADTDAEIARLVAFREAIVEVLG